MEDGALGLGSSFYAPAYAKTEELIALAKVVGEYDGMYIFHLRSEGNRLLEAIDELIRIAREGGVAAEIYQLKMAGTQNWHKFDEAVARVEAARAEALQISADIYTYTAGSTAPPRLPGFRKAAAARESACWTLNCAPGCWRK